MSRECCSKCSRPINYCYCHLLNPIQNKTHIILLKHNDENDHPFNTGKICELNFLNITTFIGEDFSDHQELLDLIKLKQPTLLFYRPELKEQLISTRATIKSIVVIDASWKKAKKIYFTNKFLHDLPTVVLPSNLPSNYSVRKAPKEGLFSTIESIVYALNIIENKDYSKSLAPFIEMNKMQKDF